MKVNQDRVAVDDGLRYRPMETCPLECKVLLLTKEGIAVLGKIKAKETLSLWDGWFPLPKRRIEYRPMETCPLECKVLLLTREGVAVLGKVKAKESLGLYDGWFPLPKRRIE